MEPWQKSYIKQTLSELQKLTVLNVELRAILQKDVLSDGDIDTLETIGYREGKIAQSQQLFKILETKHEGYEKVTNALLECKQSGAWTILNNGFINNKSKISSNLKPSLVFASKFLLQNQVYTFQQLFDGKITTEDLTLIINNCKENDIKWRTINGDNVIVLTRDLIPSEPTFYIPRTISTRLSVDPKIFRRKSEDVFVFKGIILQDLSKMVNPIPTEKSSWQLMAKKLISRFILLENDIDWEELKRKKSSENWPNPMHLITVEKVSNEEQKYFLECSTGGSIIFCNPCQEERLFMSEDDFLNKIGEENNGISGVCICDTPGMGKTLLFQSLSRKVAKTHPKCIVAFIELSNFLTKDFEIEISDDESISISLNQICDHISSSKFSKKLLLKAAERNCFNMHLFFDGLDEVPLKKMATVKNFLKAIVSSKNVKIYVSSRAHLRLELEETLSVISYDILPFTQKNQVDFLVNFWKSIYSNLQDNKLKTFALYCIQNFRETCKDTEQDLVGVPFIYFLLADVHIENAKIFASPHRNSKTQILADSFLVYELYKTFMEKRFCQKYIEKETIDEVKNFHVWKALQLLFPEIANDFSTLENINDDNYLLFGILTEIGTTDDEQNITFIHRTMAEFLVAEYLAGILLSTRSNDNISQKRNELKEYSRSRILKFTANNIFAGSETICFQITRYLPSHLQTKAYIFLSKFDNETILYFLNDCLGTTPSERFIVEQVAMKTFLESLEPMQLYHILQCCIYHNHIYTFQAFKYILKFGSKSQVRKHKVYLTKNRKSFSKEGESELPSKLLLLMAAEYSTRKMGAGMIKECFDLYQDCFKVNLKTSCKCLQLPEKSPLLVAVVALQKGKYELLEYLHDCEDKSKCNFYDLILPCITNSYCDTLEIVERKIEICVLLISESGRKGRKPQNLKNILVQGDGEVHLEIIKFFVKEGANIFATDMSNQTILYSAAHYMSSNDFREFCRFLIQECGAKSLFKTQHPKWFQPLHYILNFFRFVDDGTLEMILDEIEIDGNETDDQGNSLVLAAATGLQSLSVIKALVGHGANYKQKNKFGQNVLHLAAMRGNIEIVEYFLSTEVPLSLEDQDNEGNTTLLWAFNSLEMVKYLVKNNAKVDVINNDGDTIAHRGSDCMLDGNVFHELVKYLSYLPKG